MIFGSVNFNERTQHSDQLFQNILNHLVWNNSVPEKFSFDGFHCVFISDIGLRSQYEDVFFADEKYGIAVLIDGFIYNSQEIILKLSVSDKTLKIPELITKAYLKWGVSFADQLNGDFAICIYQKKDRQVTFFRDHIGLRPFAVARSGVDIYFATDAMGLSRSMFKHEKIGRDYLLNLFMLEGYDYSLLPHKDILSLLPGHYLQISPDHQTHAPYWFPQKSRTDHNLTRPQILRDLYLLLTDAVKIRADNRFKASAHLSGGLDSGVVASLVRKEYGEQIDFYGFSWSPDSNVEPIRSTRDERLHVDKICQLNNIIPVYCNFNFDDYLTFLSDWRHPSELMTERKTVESARSKGVNLIFSGWGGDEFISCAERGIDADLIRNFDWKYFLEKYPPSEFRRFFSAFLINGLFPALGYPCSRYKTEKAIYQYIKGSGSNRIPPKERFNYKTRRNVHLQLITRNHLAARAADWYVLGQRNGIEYRYPLLDKRIVEYMLKVPSRCLVDGNRSRIILRELGKGLLPDEVLTNYSKTDPAIAHLFKSIVKGAKKQFISEFELYRTNPDLNFIDFDLLAQNLPEISADNMPQSMKNNPSIFYYLKSAHEFTKGYYGEP